MRTPLYADNPQVKMAHALMCCAAPYGGGQDPAIEAQMIAGSQAQQLAERESLKAAVVQNAQINAQSIVG